MCKVLYDVYVQLGKGICMSEDEQYDMIDTVERFQCIECGRLFRSLRALHSHESLSEVSTLTDHLCEKAPGRCRPNRISGRCETHSNEARSLIRERQRLRYIEAGKSVPLPLRRQKRRPAIARLVEAYES